VTWDDLVDAAVNLTKREGDEIVQAGFLANDFRYIEAFASWMLSNGGTLHDDDFTQATFNNDKAVQALEYQLALLNEHQVSWPISPDRQDEQLFMQGKVGIIYAGTWSSAQFATQAPEGFRYWYILFPQGPQGTGPGATTWSNMFVLPKATKTTDQAWELMRYCTTPPVVITRFELSTRTTPLKAIFESDAWAKVLEVAPARAVTIPAAEAGGVYPFFPFFTEANDALGIELQQVMTGGKDIQEALNAAEEKINEIIARRGEGAAE
jgi:ABC-type glycerol-3-phosphate transport system substrate-binding protein